MTIEPELHAALDGQCYAVSGEVVGNVRLADIILAVCTVFNVSRNDFISHRRFRQFCDARHVYFWIARKHTTCSYPMISMRCGNRDHSTAMHGAEKISRNFANYEPQVNRVLGMLGLGLEVSA